ncbi:MAG: hypothetical protein HOQ45_05375 [Nocardioidaceae bacterium]|nr:hypothetical protein [Nocardioidaceae bacterium]
MPTTRRRRALVAVLVLVTVLVAVVAVAVAVRPGPPSASPPPRTPAPSPTPTTTPTTTPPTATPSPSTSPPGPAPGVDGRSFTLASFNTLGASHTTRTGKLPQLASGAARTPAAIRLLDRHRVDVVGLQEFQGSQFRAFRARAGGTWATFSARGDTENAIAWRRDRWQLVSARTFGVPYFGGHPRSMPIVRLRDRVSGREMYFVNVHNPADTRRFGKQPEFRAAAVRREVALMRQLARTRVPVFLTGDMNDRRDVYCALTTGRLMVAADAGRGGDRCRPPTDAGIDWIFGRGGFTFSRFVRDRTPRRDGTSDHPIVVTRVTFS